MEKELFKAILGEMIDLKYEDMEPIEILKITMGAVASFTKQNSIAFNYDIPCQTCGGMGEVSSMERVYPNEPHEAPIGSAPCPDCSSRGNDDYDNQE